jgi:hypothetical protein
MLRVPRIGTWCAGRAVTARPGIGKLIVPGTPAALTALGAGTGGG